jgi:hypothetical protein
MPRRSPPRSWLSAALIAVAATLVLAAPAHAQGVIGGQLFATGGTVDIVVQPATAGFTSQLFLLHPDGTRENIALNTEVGKHVTVGPFPAGQELQFGITVLDTGNTFFMGPASRNPDGVAHAEVTETGVRTFLVGFEDVFGGGDLDYDDNVFQFTGNLAPNRPPVADDQTLTTPEDTPIAVVLTGSDPDGTALTFAVAGAPGHGTLSGTAPSLTYTPAANFHGSDSFTFTADDGESTDTGTVAIVVTPVNDVPVAGDDAASTDENAQVTIPVLGNDSDPDGDALTAALVSGAAHGTATCDGTACTYRPVSNFVGTDTFTYEACDPAGACDEATVTVTVRGIGRPGRLTGGAFTRTLDGKIHHQAQLACTAEGGGRLTVRSKAGTFELTRVDYALCVDDPGFESAPPDAGWNTHRGSGTGTFNGVPGYTIEWTLIDGGEPAVADRADIVVRSPGGAVVLSETGVLGGGNHQAHAD